MTPKYNEILKLIKINKFNDAKKICEEIKLDLADNYEFINIYGYVLFKLENYKEAIELYKKLNKIKPNYSLPLNNLAYA